MRKSVATGLLLVLAAGAHADVRTPVLKWAYGGCTSYCQTGWYSSPLVVDVDGDGKPEVIAGSYDLVLLDGASGAVRQRVTSAARIWPGIAYGDLAGDGHPTVVIGRGGGVIGAYDPATLAPRSGWPVTAFGAEVRAVALGDLDANRHLAIIAAVAQGTTTHQVTVYAANATVRAGWPRLAVGDAGYAAGVYNDNVAIADLTGSGFAQIYVPTDVHYILGLARDGSGLQANALFGSGKVWAEVGVHVNQSDDIRGYADCSAPGLGLRPNFAASAPAIADPLGNGKLELAVVGNV